MVSKVNLIGSCFMLSIFFTTKENVMFEKILPYEKLQAIFQQANSGQLSRQQLRDMAGNLNNTASKSKDDREVLLASLILLKFVSEDTKPTIQRRLRQVSYNGSSARSFRSDYRGYTDTTPGFLGEENLMLWWMLANDSAAMPENSHFSCGSDQDSSLNTSGQIGGISDGDRCSGDRASSDYSEPTKSNCSSGAHDTDSGGPSSCSSCSSGD